MRMQPRAWLLLLMVLAEPASAQDLTAVTREVVDIEGVAQQRVEARGGAVGQVGLREADDRRARRADECRRAHRAGLGPK